MSSGAEHLPVAGVGPLSVLDYPGQLALTVFTPGCPWRCAYCHNAELREAQGDWAWSWPQVRGMLEERRGILGAVVFCGGEPTLHAELEAALRETRALGFRNGLHTAGSFPERLPRLLPLLDWAGLDVKAPFDERYARLTGDSEAVAKVQSSLALLHASGLPLQLRTTVPDGPAGDALFGEVCAQMARSGYAKPVRQSIRRLQPAAPHEEVP